MCVWPNLHEAVGKCKSCLDFNSHYNSSCSSGLCKGETLVRLHRVLRHAPELRSSVCRGVAACLDLYVSYHPAQLRWINRLKTFETSILMGPWFWTDWNIFSSRTEETGHTGLISPTPKSSCFLYFCGTASKTDRIWICKALLLKWMWLVKRKGQWEAYLYICT